MKTFSLITVIALLYICSLNGCSKPLIRTEPGWEKRSPECSTVGLCVIRGKSTWSDTVCMKLLFGEDEPVEKFNGFLETTMRQSVFRNVACQRVVVVEEPQVEEKEFLQIRDEKYQEFNVPATDFLADLHRHGIDFLFLIDTYTVSIIDRYYRREKYLMNNSFTMQKKIEDPERPEPLQKGNTQLKHRMKFVLLSCKTGEKVHYGVIDASKDHAINSKEKWEEVIFELGEIALKNSPLSAEENKKGK